MQTKVRLANVLKKNGLSILTERALKGQYDDYESQSPTPQINLVNDLMKAERPDLARRVINGEFDGNKEEAEIWFNKEGRKLLFEK